MKTASVREVQHHLSQILEQVEQGESITVTRHNRVIARIIPAQPPLRRVKMPDFQARLKKLFPNGAIKGAPQEFWDDVRKERF